MVTGALHRAVRGAKVGIRGPFGSHFPMEKMKGHDVLLVAGGLLAHVLRYVNPAMFSVQKLAEVLAMVYFGGLNSVYGAIVGATSISLLGEALRPLEIFKWIIIPLLLILVMIFRPTGLIAFKEFDVRQLVQPKK